MHVKKMGLILATVLSLAWTGTLVGATALERKDTRKLSTLEVVTEIGAATCLTMLRCGVSKLGDPETMQACVDYAVLTACEPNPEGCRSGTSNFTREDILDCSIAAYQLSCEEFKNDPKAVLKACVRPVAARQQ